MAQFNTLHIFSYGETQLIADSDLPQGKVNSSDLTHLEPFITHVKTFKPEDKIEGDYHVIHIFKGFNGVFLNQQDNASYEFEYSQLDTTLLNNLTDEIISLLSIE